ncbi:MAG: NAD+ synthase [Pseudohongiellaceae bacterium]|tara:strand:- start:2045 stop:3694 length:1650 start_codon:yes stop_codon:yes gene_type:complete
MAQQLTIVMAQLNFLVGDIDGNTDLVIASAQRAITEKSADMIVFPELTLVGYPPEDLLLRPSLQVRVEKALAKILAANLDIFLVLGYPFRQSAKLYNALGVIKKRECLGVYLKQCLPNYQVFDEHRYFSPGSDPLVLELLGTRCAFTICEDLWESGPIQQTKSAGAQLAVNINASPFHINKLVERKELLSKRCKQVGFPILYINLIGGQDELVFDGGSMAANAEGECCFQAPSYVEGLYSLEILVSQDGRIEIPHKSIANDLDLEADVYQSLVLGVRDYVNKNKFKGVVLGLSGGIDSALTLAIAVDALGSDRVQAVMMPFEFTSQLSLDVAAKQAKKLGVNYQVIAINEIYHSFIDALSEEFAGTAVDVSEQNIQARARGVLLMAISNKQGLLVLTTGNKSEIAVGYSTLYGDMAGGFDVLKDVSKTLVYKLANYRNNSFLQHREEIIPQLVIDRAPSAELAPNQVDQDSLPDYEVLDQILELYIEKDRSAEDIIKDGFAEDIVRRILRLVDLNEYKRRQSPVGVRLTERGFGRDRRYPITNAWLIGE